MNAINDKTEAELLKDEVDSVAVVQDVKEPKETSISEVKDEGLRDPLEVEVPPADGSCDENQTKENNDVNNVAVLQKESNQSESLSTITTVSSATTETLPDTESMDTDLVTPEPPSEESNDLIISSSAADSLSNDVEEKSILVENAVSGVIPNEETPSMAEEQNPIETTTVGVDETCSNKTEETKISPKDDVIEVTEIREKTVSPPLSMQCDPIPPSPPQIPPKPAPEIPMEQTSEVPIQVPQVPIQPTLEPKVQIEEKPVPVPIQETPVTPQIPPNQSQVPINPEPINQFPIQSKPELFNQVPIQSKPELLNQVPIQSKPEPIEKSPKEKTPPIQEDTKKPSTKELLIPAEQLQILSRYLNQEQLLPIKQLSELSQKTPLVENNLNNLTAVVDKLSSSQAEKPEKLISPSAEVAAILKSPIKDVDVDMADLPKEIKKISPVKEVLPVNGDVLKDEKPSKRRSSEDAETESPLKKLCQEVEKTFPHHDAMINDFIHSSTKNNVDEIQKHTEQLLAEIQTLRELAQKKEHEWNNILHLKKVKEEILLRLLRKKQVISFEKSAEVNGSGKDPFEYLNQPKNLAIDKSDEISGLALKQPTPPINPSMPINPMMQPPVMPVTTHFNPLAGLPPPYDKVAHMQSMPKPVFPQTMMMAGPTMPGFPRDMNGQLAASYMPMGRQGPTKDVKSIIADYRQRNPDLTPRRGRRMKTTLNPNMMNNPRQIAPKVENLGNLGMIFNNLDMNQKAMLERLSQMQAANLTNGMSFKDVLVQFANMQQPLMPGRPEMMPRPEAPRPERRRPERPHQEEKQERERDRERERERQREAASPRLPPPPPYPEISLLPVTTQEGQSSLLHGILTKNCGEITITPVQPAPEPPPPEKQPQEEVVQLDDEESPPSEGSASGESRAEPPEEPPEEPPLCQGCRKRDAQFVCAGCANQWYCSRDCQVAAWDDHSEMCSG